MPTRNATKRTAVKKAAKGSAPNKNPTVAYLAEQPAEKRVLLEKLRSLVEKGIPDAEASIKWGVPIYQLNGRNVCALASFKDHVAINFFAPPSVLIDPGKKLEGAGKSSRLLKVRNTADIDSASILRWLKAAAAANS
jgi:hypothetical protein